MVQTSFSTFEHKDRDELNKRFHTRAWALFLIMSGLSGLISHFTSIDGFWLISTGGILLGLNVVRALNDIETSGFTVILGLLALSTGLWTFMDVGLPVVPLLMIGIGALVIFGALTKNR